MLTPARRNTTVPLDGTGETVAVKSTECPATTGLADAVSAVLVGVRARYVLTRLARFGEPQPVTSSQPAPAACPPADPVVTSWNAEWYTNGLLAIEYSAGARNPMSGFPAWKSFSFQIAVMPAQSGAARLVPPT